MAREPISRQVASAVDEGWVVGSAFIGSILSGVLVGYLLDRWLDTGPWLVVTGVLLGSYSGFLRLWHYAKTQGAKQDEERRGR